MDLLPNRFDFCSSDGTIRVSCHWESPQIPFSALQQTPPPPFLPSKLGELVACFFSFLSYHPPHITLPLDAGDLNGCPPAAVCVHTYIVHLLCLVNATLRCLHHLQLALSACDRDYIGRPPRSRGWEQAWSRAERSFCFWYRP